MAIIRELKESLHQHFADIGQALGSPKRLELLELLNQCEKSVETLATNTSMSIANTSQHLQILRNSGLVETRRKGVRIFYRLADDSVHALVSSVKRVAERRNADVDRLLETANSNTEEFAEVDRAKLMELAEAGAILVLDIRPEDEYRAGHIPHALSVPLAELKDYLVNLPQGLEIVAYCRGPYCVLTGEAVRIIQNAGYSARRLQDGITEWKAAGLPVASE